MYVYAYIYIYIYIVYIVHDLTQSHCDDNREDIVLMIYR